MLARNGAMNMVPVISRAEAKAHGRARYFTGKPCKLGHIAERLVSNWGCLECAALARSTYREANRDRVLERGRARMRAFREVNPALVRERDHAWREANRGAVLERQRARWAVYSENNRDIERERLRVYRESNRDRVRLGQRAWCEANRDRVRERSRVWYEANRDRIQSNREARREQERAWYAANPARHHEKRHRRRAILHSVPGRFTAADWRALVARSPRCHWCGKSFIKTRKPTHDHVIPLSKGGANSPENSVCACRPCNSSKRDRLINPASGQGLLL